jgi:hypothetical protein
LEKQSFAEKPAAVKLATVLIDKITPVLSEKPVLA